MTFSEFINQYQKIPVVEFPNRTIESVPAPLVSCRVSTYCHAAYIRQCLDGILRQRAEFPFEVVIGEDDSKDGTRQICIEYAQRHPERIRLLLHRRENNILVNGRPSAKFQGNYTRRQCRGKYQASCEGDDYWTDPEKLRRQVEFLEENPGYSGCFTNYSVVDEGDAELAASARGKGQEAEYDRISILRKGLPQTCTVMYRKLPAVEEAALSFLQVINGDQVYAALMAQHGPIKYLDCVTAARRMGSGTFSTLPKADQYRRAIETFTALKGKLTKSDEQEALNERLDVLYFQLMMALTIKGDFKQACDTLAVRRRVLGCPGINAIVRMGKHVFAGLKAKLGPYKRAIQ